MNLINVQCASMIKYRVFVVFIMLRVPFITENLFFFSTFVVVSRLFDRSRGRRRVFARVVCGDARERARKLSQLSTR